MAVVMLLSVDAGNVYRFLAGTGTVNFVMAFS
jgi:hypothetical protein